MAKKPEATFTASVNKYVLVYNQSMFTYYSAGTPDRWYSGKRDLWVEFKYLPKVPNTIKLEKLLSKQQAYWIKERRREGRVVWIIVGCPDGGCIVGGDMTKTQFLENLKTRRELGEAINTFCQS